MSAICGIYHLDGKKINPEITASMMKELGIYQSDFSDTWKEGPLFFGCHTQYITPESVHERLPFHDGSSNMVITADAILDNREELLDKLGIKCQGDGSIDTKMKWNKAETFPEVLSGVSSSTLAGKTRETSPYLSDSYLILKAYQKWGKECTAHLLGDFAFVLWDGNRDELFCAVDHTGNRTLYYYHSPRLFAFSTLIKPLYAMEEIEKKYCDEWICDYLSIPSVIHQLDSELTIYKDILLLPAAHTLTVNRNGIHKESYWQVAKQPELKLKSDQEYGEAFRHVLGQAVRCRLRSIKPVGIMLSGGLDSTTVASIAAPELGKSGKYLHAFSSIPMMGYQSNLKSNTIADETPYIETMKAYYKNVDVTYCPFEGKHSLSDTNRLLAVLEQPYKILENLYWIDGISARAEDKNVGVILTGGMGNTTISYGIFKQCIISLMRSGKWKTLINEIRAYSELKKSRPLRIVADLLKSFLPYEAQKTWYRMRNSNWDLPLRISPINLQFADQMDQRGRFKKHHFDPYYIKKMDALQYRQMMLAPANMSHLSSIYTKLALSHNLILRDPTFDKRVIEFCLSVPVEQYIRDGRERFLLRQAMKGILPDKVRLNFSVRGQQSADFVQRLQPMEQEIREEVMKIGQHRNERKYLDIHKIHSKINKMDLAKSDTFYDYDIRMLLRSIVFSRFIKQ